MSCQLHLVPRANQCQSQKFITNKLLIPSYKRKKL